MNKKRLQEIKDSVEFQYTLAKAKGYDNALLFTNEEEELIEEIERLQQRIDKAIEYIENNKYDFEKWETQMLLNILKGSDK